MFASVFVSNYADELGGANYQCSARRSLFLENEAKFGGAIEEGSASECTFRKNIAKISGGAKFKAYVADSEFDGNLPSFSLYASDFTGLEGFGGNINIKNNSIRKNFFIRILHIKILMYRNRFRIRRIIVYHI